MYTHHGWITAALIGVVVAAAGCSSDTVAPIVPTTLTATSGSNGQTGTVGQALALPVGVTLVDQNGKPIAGATVNWTVVGRGGSVASPSSTTDSTGTATVVWTLGDTVGVDSLKAADPFGPSTVITATGDAGQAASLVKVSGDTQSVAAGTAATQPLVVKVVDQFGNPVAGVTVSFAVASGGGNLSVASGVTDANGEAQTTLTTGATPGANTVTATAGTFAPVTFTLTGT